MIITCINCNTKYSINKQSLGKKGKKVKCSNCGHEWFQKSEITKKKLKIKPLEEEQAVTDNNKEIYSTKIFSQEKTKKKKNYNFL